jgi:hypothetical protein
VDSVESTDRVARFTFRSRSDLGRKLDHAD